MKKSENRVPEFDEIIFRNRNKSYGAYDLRKRYKSIASLSVLSGAAIISLLVIGLSLSIDRSIASVREPETIVIKIDPYKPEFIKPEAEKPQKEMMKDVIRNLKPVVTEDTSALTDYFNTAVELMNMETNHIVTDTMPEIYTEDPVIDAKPEPVLIVEEMPEFPGGQMELLRTIANNINYPEAAVENNIEGRVVLRFAVNTDGSVDRITLLSGIDPSLDNEAIRVIGTLPRFKPGKQNGVPVAVWFTIPVTFRLE